MLFRSVSQSRYLISLTDLVVYLNAKNQGFSDAARAQARQKTIRKSRYRSRNIYRQPRSIGVPVRLTYQTDVTTGLNSPYYGQKVIGLVYALQNSNDWGSMAALYAQYKVQKIHVTIIPGFCMTPSNGSCSLAGIAYDNGNSGALTQINQVSDYENYALTTFNNVVSIPKTFTFTPRPRTNWPLPSSSSDENMGWIKAVSTQDGGGSSRVVMKLIIKFYVYWGSLE